jgi:two-component system nitrate/nitrite response regulator NarL
MKSAKPVKGTALLSRTREALRLFIVSRIALHRRGLARMLADQPSLNVLGDGAPDDLSLRRIDELRPSVVLTDSASARTDGFVRGASAAAPGCRVVVLGVSEETEVIGCAEAGVSGYLSAETSARDLVDGLHTLQQGSFLCPAATAEILLRKLSAPPQPEARSADAHLTARETDILRLVDRGLSNKEIARELCICLPTVKNHVHHILEKLGVARRSAAAARVRNLPEPKDLVPGTGPADPFTPAPVADRMRASIAGHGST